MEVEEVEDVFEAYPEESSDGELSESFSDDELDPVESYFFEVDRPAPYGGRTKLNPDWEEDRQKRYQQLEDIFVPLKLEEPVQVFSAKAPDAQRLPGCEVLLDHAVINKKLDVVEVSVPGYKGEIPLYAVYAYFACQMYLTNTHRLLYDSYIAARKAPTYPIPVTKADDGQLKIVVDFMIGIDNLIFREFGSYDQFREVKRPLAILVIGSSSEGGVSGVAYKILPLLDIQVKIDMYDPYESNVTEQIGQVEYVRHRAFWKYGDSVEKYDIVFDDAYLKTRFGVSRLSFDPNRTILTARDFSVKYLMADLDYFTSRVCCYEQAAKLSNSHEHRGTRYPRTYGQIVDNFDGKCGLCIEFKYMTRLVYSNRVLDYVLRAHKRNCVSGVEVFSRAVLMRDNCCNRVTTPGLPRIFVCPNHKSYMKLYRVKALASSRTIYLLKTRDGAATKRVKKKKSCASVTETIPVAIKLNMIDYSSVAKLDVVVVAHRTVTGAVVECPKRVFAIAVSIVIRLEEDYFVSVLMGNEVALESNLEITLIDSE